MHHSCFPHLPLCGVVLTAAVIFLPWPGGARVAHASAPGPRLASAPTQSTSSGRASEGLQDPTGTPDIAETGGASGDPHGSPGDRGAVVTREVLIAQVLAQHPRLTRADAGAEASAEEASVEGAWPGPMVEVGLAPLSLLGQGEAGWDVSVSQPLPITGRRRAAKQRAVSEAAAALARTRGERHALAWQVVEAYEQLRVLQHGLEINAHHRAVMLETQRSARALYASGALSRSQVLRVEGGLIKLSRERISLEADEAEVRARLNVARGKSVSAPLRVDTAPRDRVSIPALHALLNEARSQRPELEAGEKALEASRSGVREAKSSLWPEPQLMTSYSTMWAHPEHRWMVGVGVDLMALTGRAQAAVSAARFRERQGEAALAEAQLRVREEVAAAHARLTAALRIEQLVRGRQTEVAREALEAARLELGTGTGGVRDFLEAEEALRQVEFEALEARAQVELKAAALALAVGRIPGVEVER